MNLTAIIADTDSTTTTKLKSIIEEKSWINFVGEVKDGNELLTYCANLMPDIIFLEIQLAGVEDFSAIKRIKEINPNVFIIFVSCSSLYAINAFELSAVDYCIKPLNKSSIQRALEKVQKYYKGVTQNNKKVTLLVNKKKSVYIYPEDFIFAETFDRHSVIHTIQGDAFHCAENINSLKNKFNDPYFIQSHRSFLINAKKIREIVSVGDRAYQIVFDNYKSVASLSRINKKKLECYLKSAFFCTMVFLKELT